MHAARNVNCHGGCRRLCAPAMLVFSAAALLAAGLSCSQTKPSEPRTPRDVQVPEYLKDTVGELCRFSGRELIGVQGFGFVTGLDATGTKVVPPGIRQQMLDIMHRHKVVGAEDILSSPDNAVVLVSGYLPPGIAKGEQFDLEVRAVPTTETTSLEGGYLLECELVRVVSTRGVAAKTDTLALGRGSIFVSPFAADEQSKAAADPRAGRVLAGGKALKARHFFLALLTPSVRTADQILRLVNSRFPGSAKGTTDPGRVDIEVPAQYQDDKAHFLDLVGAVYLRELPGARDQRVALLVETLKEGKDVDRVAICLEAIGPSVLPHLKPVAAQAGEAVRFYLGRTLANLQDAQAVAVLEPIILDDRSEFQELAVEALGHLRSGLGLGVLSRALNAKSARVRVAAWQAMENTAPRTFLARIFPDKFFLSLVTTTAEPFVYVSRTLKPQVAIFGDVTIRPPVLAETRRVIATAREGDKEVTLIVHWHGHDYRMRAPLDVRGLIEKMAAPAASPEDWPDASSAALKPPEGLDLSYSDVVGVLYEMSRKKALSAPLVLQPLQYHIGGDRPTVRPIGTEEQDLSAPAPAPGGTGP